MAPLTITPSDPLEIFLSLKPQACTLEEDNLLPEDALRSYSSPSYPATRVYTTCVQGPVGMKKSHILAGVTDADW